ncbi:class III extradiol dioxygenase subunit B-like domain-containing protein [Streptomyces boninensis]|uniref:class III extradiol dioxygenase subunit B-like domain-containing protein n=1 Tax=Streptomyces boninensis TaxID=2039455 RepID=UPI003B2188F4
MLIAAACCPCPPLLVPEVASGAAAELDELRAACSDAVGLLAAARPERLIVVGPAEQAGRGPHPQGSTGSFKGFGVDLQVRLGPGDDGGGESARELPPSLAVGAWLLERAQWAEPVEALGVGEPLAAESCLEVGRELAAGAGRVALLVMGDGSACRTEKAPGYFDERAAPFDAAAARALGAADLAALAGLDAELAYDLQASGRACWQVLAGAAEGADLRGTLRYDEAPYGVGYFVATWS